MLLLVLVPTLLLLLVLAPLMPLLAAAQSAASESRPRVGASGQEASRTAACVRGEGWVVERGSEKGQRNHPSLARPLEKGDGRNCAALREHRARDVCIASPLIGP